MLIDILRMPPVFGVPIDRRLSINAPIGTSHDSVTWPSLPLYRDALVAGSNITRTPQNLYKTVHVSEDSNWVFETVFCTEPEGIICLYTKVINAETSVIGISLNAIKFYRQSAASLFPISHFLVNASSRGFATHCGTLVRYNSLDNVVLPIFGERQLWTLVNKFLEHGLESVESAFAWSFRPIYEYIPATMEALMQGKYTRSPFADLIEHHPLIELPHDKWFNHEIITHAMEARGLKTHINHPAFDTIVVDLMRLFPVKFQFSCLLSHGIDHLTDLWLTRAYHDAYGLALKGMIDKTQKDTLASIVYESIMIYCKIYEVDYAAFTNSVFDKSSIIIGKNLYDEIEIIIHDLVNDRYVCFYTSFPVLALTTLAVAGY